VVLLLPLREEEIVEDRRQRCERRSGGLSEAQTRACVADNVIATASTVSRKGAEDAGVDATPSFFINGRKAALGSMEDLERLQGEAAAKP